MEELIVTVLFFLVKINILKTERFRLDIEPIAPVYWVDGESIFVNEQERSYRYDVVKREALDEYERRENELWGYCKEGVFLCGWENREINSPDEFSTHLKVDGRDGNNILDVELKPTVEIVECRSNPLLKTVFPIEERYFSFQDELYEVESYEIDMLSPNFKRLLGRDSLGNYWVTEFRINR